MSTVAVALPENLRDFSETKWRQGEFAGASDYTAALVDPARSKRSELEEALLQGLENASVEEWTLQEWAGRKMYWQKDGMLAGSHRALPWTRLGRIFRIAIGTAFGIEIEFRSAGRKTGTLWLNEWQVW